MSIILLVRAPQFVKPSFAHLKNLFQGSVLVKTLDKDLSMTVHTPGAFLRFERNVHCIYATEDATAGFRIAAASILTRFIIPPGELIAIRTHRA